MFRRINKTKNKGRQAFTLVELIVVLVILAIVAAMLVPALTGYIKKAKKEKLVTNAQTALVASQAVMTELYGLGPGAMSNNAYDPNSGHSSGNNGGGMGGDVRWDDAYNLGNYDAASLENLAWGDKVLNLMDRDRSNQPYIFIFGVGHSQVASLSTTEKYTVYYVGYLEDKNSPSVYYINGEWIYKYPRDDAKIMKEVRFKFVDGTTKGVRNTIVMNGANIPVQFYVVSTPTPFDFTIGKDSLQSHSEGHNGY